MATELDCWGFRVGSIVTTRHLGQLVEARITKLESPAQVFEVEIRGQKFLAKWYRGDYQPGDRGGFQATTETD